MIDMYVSVWHIYLTLFDIASGHNVVKLQGEGPLTGLIPKNKGLFFVKLTIESWKRNLFLSFKIFFMPPLKNHEFSPILTIIWNMMIHNTIQSTHYAPFQKWEG